MSLLKPQHWWSKFMAHLVTGVTVLVPVLIIYWITVEAYHILDAIFSPVLEGIETGLGREINHLLGVSVAVAFTLGLMALAGYAVTTKVGKWFHNHFDNVLEKAHPLYSLSRDSVQMIVESISSEDGFFAKPVMIRTDYGLGGWGGGILIGDTAEDFESGGPEEMVNVFLFHGPIGHTGNLMLVPKASVVEVPEMDIDEWISVNVRFGYGIKDHLKMHGITLQS